MFLEAFYSTDQHFFLLAELQVVLILHFIQICEVVPYFFEVLFSKVLIKLVEVVLPL